MIINAEIEKDENMIPQGMVPAICVLQEDVTVKGRKGTECLKLRLHFDVKHDGKELRIFKDYIPSLHNKSELLADMTMWLNENAVEYSKKRFDPATLVNKPVILTIMHRKKGKTTVPAIVSMLPANGVTILAPAADVPGNGIGELAQKETVSVGISESPASSPCSQTVTSPDVVETAQAA